jgi:hypothetical protein
MKARLGLSCCALLAIRCADVPVERHAERIVDGELSSASEDGVVMLRAEVNGVEVLCSASLVAPNLIVTARHCVSYLTPGLFNCTVRGELVDNPEGGGSLGQHLPAESISVFDNTTPRHEPLAHGTRIVSTLAPAICVNDIAFMVLDTELDLPIVPIRLNRPALLKEDVTLLGFGLTDERQNIDYALQKRRRKGGLQIAGVGPDSIDDGVTTVPPRALILNGPSGCVGDSGGPLLASNSGALLGVYSLQAGESCLAPNVRHQLVHVSPFRALLEEAFAAAGAIPTPEAENEPEGGQGGAGGTAGNEQGGEAGTDTDAPEPVDGDGSADSSCSAIRRAPPGSRWSWLIAIALVLARRRARR